MRLPLPDSLVAQARAYADGSAKPATPRNAATVVLLRPSEDPAHGPDVYLLRRQTSMAFAAGMCVFPGGSVDDRDFDASVAWAGPSPAEWAVRLGVDDEHLARALVCAAVRETFEESGVLLAGTSDADVVADVTGDDWEADRQALENRRLAFTEQPQVANGASDLLGEVFGDAGKHARSAVGVAALPLDAPVEVELIAEVS
jgi:enamine deaminase RidA (YjgF/YER057c/UK114 family)